MRYLILVAAMMLAACNDTTLSAIDTTIRDNLPYYCEQGEKAHQVFVLGEAFLAGRIPDNVRVPETKAYVSLRYLCQGDPSTVTAFDIVVRAYQAYTAIKAAEREASSL